MNNRFEGKEESKAREEILALVEEYCDRYHNKKEYKKGDRISYASRVFYQVRKSYAKIFC